MASIHRTVQCPLPGLESVAVTFNMMASESQINAWTGEIGGGDASPVIVSVEGWPGGELGENPFGPDAPLAFRLWAVQKGLQDALRAYVTDPN